MTIDAAALVLSLAAGAASVQAPAPSPSPSLEPLPNCPELAIALSTLIRNDLRLRDWAQLGRYRDANARLAPPSATEARVVFMGDSITDAWDDEVYGGFFPGRPWSIGASADRRRPRCSCASIPT